MNSNVKQYIASGILELYVSGLLSPEENQEVHAMIQRHPEVELEVREIEKALGTYISATATKEPATDVLARAMVQIELEEEAEKAIIDDADASNREEALTKIRQLRYWRYGAIAACILLLISLVTNFLFYNTWQSTEQELLAVQTDNLQLVDNNNILRTSTDRLEDIVLSLSQASQQRIVLEGLENHPTSSAIVFWNPNSAEVLLYVENLPVPREGFQYQLWAIIAGEPVDAGVFELEQAIQKQKSISGEALAFAITLEPKGGSPSPTLEQMFALGQVG